MWTAAAITTTLPPPLPCPQRAPSSGGRLQVVQLQLALLNRLCLAGPTPTEGPQRLLLAQVGCRRGLFGSERQAHLTQRAALLS